MKRFFAALIVIYLMSSSLSYAQMRPYLQKGHVSIEINPGFLAPPDFAAYNGHIGLKNYVNYMVANKTQVGIALHTGLGKPYYVGGGVNIRYYFLKSRFNIFAQFTYNVDYVIDEVSLVDNRSHWAFWHLFGVGFGVFNIGPFGISTVPLSLNIYGGGAFMVTNFRIELGKCGKKKQQED